MSHDSTVPRRTRVLARSGLVRLLVFFFVLAVVYAGGQAVIRQAIHQSPKDLTDAVAVSGALLLSVLAISIYGLLVGLFERRAALELAPRRGVPLLAGGLLLGFVMFGVVYGVLWVMGHAQWAGFAGTGNLTRIAAAAVVAGVCEELVVRGGAFRILEDMFGTTVALLVSGLLFGAMHLGNPHVTLFAAAAIALEAGVLLAAAYAASRNLWLPIGLHIGWNFTEGGVFGAAVSGSGGGHGLVKMPLQGPELFTGGAFGPEASVVAVAICFAVGLYFIVQTMRRGRWVRASFHMMLD